MQNCSRIEFTGALPPLGSWASNQFLSTNTSSVHNSLVKILLSSSFSNKGWKKWFEVLIIVCCLLRGDFNIVSKKHFTCWIGFCVDFAILLLKLPCSCVIFLPHLTHTHTHLKCKLSIRCVGQSHGLSARRGQRTKSRGPKGLQVEVGAQGTPRLLVLV